MSETMTTVEELYWLGTLPGSPFQNITVGGICFPAFTEEIAFTKNNETRRSERRGDLVKLTREQYDRVLKAVERRVVRWTESGVRGFILDRSSPRYRPHPKDEPLAKYVYLYRVEDVKNNPMWRESETRSLHEVLEAQKNSAKRRGD